MVDLHSDLIAEKRQTSKLHFYPQMPFKSNRRKEIGHEQILNIAGALDHTNLW